MNKKQYISAQELRYENDEWLRRFDDQDREFAIWHARRQFETLTWVVWGMAGIPLAIFIFCLAAGALERLCE